MKPVTPRDLDGLTAGELRAIVKRGETVVTKTDKALEDFVRAVEGECMAAGVPTSAVMTWHIAKVIAGLVEVEDISMERTLDIIARAVLMHQTRRARATEN